jgi:hypothetical protein
MAAVSTAEIAPSLRTAAATLVLLTLASGQFLMTLDSFGAHPPSVRFVRRLAQAGGGDVPADWSRPQTTRTAR